jgi:uncharacterized RDD family membrane protein YckC
MLSFTFQYASFWRRAIALAIDAVLLGLVSGILLDPFMSWLGLREASEALKRAPLSVAIVRAYGAWALSTILVAWIYFALQESSTSQATIGKRLMGLKVFTSEEDRLTFRAASIRFWARLLSVMTAGIGFLMALFDAKHRALHDVLAGTRVIEPRPEAFAPSVPVPAASPVYEGQKI